MDDAQVTQLMQNWRDALAKQMDELRIRQWCIERAIEAMRAGGEIDPILLSEEFFRFITAPFAETFKDAKSP